MERNRLHHILLLLSISLCAVIGVTMLEPVPQDLTYHDLVDQRVSVGVANGLNVLSNIAFLVVGLVGLQQCWFGRLSIDQKQSQSCTLFFLGVTLTAFGSGWYHLSPNNDSLLWDRLPMALAFMALLAFVVADCINTRAGQLLLWPLVALGLGSVLWWQQSELAGQGDLRFYVLTQFLPMLLLPVILLLFRSPWSHAGHYLWIFGWYGLAKICEACDAGVLNITGIVSGHTLKHLAAATSIGWFLWMLRKRRLRT